MLPFLQIRYAGGDSLGRTCLSHMNKQAISIMYTLCYPKKILFCVYSVHDLECF